MTVRHMRVPLSSRMRPYRLAWATDIHLEFCDDGVIGAFVDTVAAEAPDGLVLSGDIGTSANVSSLLRRIESALTCPVYFVLGNHDFYRGSIADVRAALAILCGGSDRLRWLRTAGPISLTADSALVGVDGWADGRFGDYAGSPVLLNDFFLIRELAGLDSDFRLLRMQQLAGDDAAILERDLATAIAAHHRVVVATHVPPFAEAAWHEGRQSDDHWLPHFSCKAVGDVLRTAAERHPDRDFLVLCGHTHGGGTVQVLPNLRVITGPAEYGRPALQHVFALG